MENEQLLSVPEARAAGVPGWGELIAVVLVVTFAAMSFPMLCAYSVADNRAWYKWVADHKGWAYLEDLSKVFLGLLLTIPTARRSGLRMGTLRGNGLKVAVVVAVPILLTAVIYPNLPERPFKGASASMWVATPFAEDSIFCGYIYGLLAQRGSKPFFRWMPLSPALLITGLLFGLYHVPNLFSFSLGYTLFQVAYTSIGAMWTGMTRVWTGTFFFVTLTHAAVNFIAWRTK